MSRSIQLINFKKHKSLEMELPGECIAFVGKNNSGKSTIIQAIEGTYRLDPNFIADPIKHGETAAKVIRRGTDIHGREIILEWRIDNERQVFTALYIDDQDKRRTISDPKKIRELIGTYFPLTVHDAFQMLKFAEGRRRFINEYILGTMSKKVQERIAEIDLSISDKRNRQTENNLFHSRTGLNNGLKALQSNLEANRLTVEEEDLIKTEGEHRKTYNKLVEAEKEVPDANVPLLNNLLSALEKSIKSTKETWESVFKNTDALDAMEINLQGLWSDFTDKLNEYDNFMSERDAIIERRKKADDYFRRVDAAKTKRNAFNSLEKQIEEMQMEIANLTEKIEQHKAERKELISKAKLPAGLSFDEDTIKLGEFEFNETVISETRARIALIQLILAINTADFIDIGDWTLYDKESRKEIVKIAKDRNCLIFGQMVTDDEDVSCTVIIDE